MDELTPDQLEAILGTDYETVLADILRRKGSAEERQHTNDPIGQVGNGHVFFDPAGAVHNYLNRRNAGKDVKAAQAEMDKVLEQQKQGRRTFAEALGHRPQAPIGAPRTVDSTVPSGMPTQGPPQMPGGPPQAPPATPVPGAPPMAPGAPPALSNASTLPPERLAAAGVPSYVQALIAKLRGR